MPESIKTILTLRYDWTIRPILPELTAADCDITFSESPTGPVKRLIVDSLKRSIQSDCKKISIALSGGIDSTLSLALLRSTFPDLAIQAISVRFQNSKDETLQASKIAAHFGAEHRIVDLKNPLSELPKAISIVRRPFWDLHWYYVVKQARTDGDLLVSGDGGDELFGGYAFRYAKFLSLVNEESSPASRVEAYLQCHGRDWVENQADLFDERMGFTWDGIHGGLMPYFDNTLSLLQQVFLADYNGKLRYNFSFVNSAIHGHFGMESVTPLLSNDMISYAFHLNPKTKYDAGSNVGKLPLRALLADYIDAGHLTQTKQGFSANTVSLWESRGYRLCEEYLTDARVVDAGWINGAWICENLKRSQDVSHVNKFLGLLALEVWYRMFVTKDLDSDTVLE